MTEERNAMLMKRHSVMDSETGETTFDISKLFELNLAHDLAKEQKKTLKFIDENDDFDDFVFKHH